MEDTIVLYPSVGRGHLPILLEIGKRILAHDPSFSITVIISTPPFEASFNDPYLDAISNIPSFTVLRLPAPAATSHPPMSSDDITLTFELTRLSNPDFHHALSSIVNSNRNIKALIIDFYCNFAVEISHNLGIPTYYFLPGTLSALAVFLYLPTIHKTTTKSLKDLDDLLHIPGVPPMNAYDMPSRMLDRGTKIYDYFLDTATQMPKSSGIIINSSEELEPRAFQAITEGQCTPRMSMSPVYCIGPFIATADQDSTTEDKHGCLTWLDTQPSRSVLFLSFGSMGRFSAEQLKEIANGLEMSGVRFLWVARPPPPGDDNQPMVAKTVEQSVESYLPRGFLERTKDNGMIVPWAPQAAILEHESVGGFVTHCGWNSMVESIMAGVPMLAWPLFADQKVNSAYIVEEIKLAVAVSRSRHGFVTAQALKLGVDELMNSTKGKQIRERLVGVREVAMAARREGGPSFLALAKLVHSFKHG